MELIKIFSDLLLLELIISQPIYYHTILAPFLFVFLFFMVVTRIRKKDKNLTLIGKDLKNRF